MELPASEIEFWKAYYSIFDFPEERADFRAARIMELLNNISQHKYFKKATSWTDFMPEYLKPAAIPETEEQKSAKERAYVDMLIAGGFAVMEKK